MRKKIELLTNNLIMNGVRGYYLFVLLFNFIFINATERPNIIFLMADDHAAHSLGIYGNNEILTPNIDKLGREGLVFDKAYATTAICMASRASVFVGMYEYKTGCNFATGNVSREMWDKNSYAALLRKAGYYTGFAGKWGFSVSDGEPGNRNSPIDMGQYFDKWGSFKGSSQGKYVTEKNNNLASYAQEYPHVTRALGAFSVDFINEAVAEDKPFCLSISFKAPHEPHDIIDEEDLEKYENTDFSFPPNYWDEGAGLLPIQAKLSRQYVQRDRWAPEIYKDHLKRYYQLIGGIDDVVGRIRDELEKLGLDKNTVIIYTSDNGYFCGRRGLHGKVLEYEEASKIPLIIYNPLIDETQGKRTNSLAGNIDYAPTILELAGLSGTKEMQGKSLIPILKKQVNEVRDDLLLMQAWDWNNSDYDRGMAVVTKEWKYIYWCFGNENFAPSEELFHLTTDPLEVNNVADDKNYAVIKDDMLIRYRKYLKDWEQNGEEKYYSRQVRIFDPQIPWQEKEFLLGRNSQKTETINNIIKKELNK